MKIAWLTPLSKFSDISHHSLAVLEAAQPLLASEPGTRIDLFIEPARHYLVPPCRPAVLGPAHDAAFFARHYDLTVFNIGNNVLNHGHINRLCLAHPGVVVVHDLMMQHYWAATIFEKNANPVLYGGLMQTLYGARAEPVLRSSGVLRPKGLQRYSPWDTPAGTEFPMIEPFLENARRLVAHSPFARRRMAEMGHAGCLELWLPSDKKPAPARTPRAPAPGAPVCFASFGDISPPKCYELLIPALARTAEAAGRVLRYRIAGRSENAPYLAQLQALADSCAGPLFSCTIETGISEARLAALKAEADAFANIRSPNTESASGSLAEQTGAGLPVLVYGSGCYGDLPDSAAEKVSGLSIAEIAEGAARLLQPERYEELARGARAYGEARTAAAYARALLDDCRALLETPAQAPAADAELPPARAAARALAPAAAAAAAGQAQRMAWPLPLDGLDAPARLSALAMRALALLPAFRLRDIERALGAMAQMLPLELLEQACAAAALVNGCAGAEQVPAALRHLHPGARRALFMFGGEAFREDYAPDLAQAVFGLGAESRDDLVRECRSAEMRRLAAMQEAGLAAADDLRAAARRAGQIQDAEEFLQLLRSRPLPARPAPADAETLRSHFAIFGGHHLEEPGLVWTRQSRAILGFRCGAGASRFRFEAAAKGGEAQIEPLTPGLDISRDGAKVSVAAAAPPAAASKLGLIAITCPGAVFTAQPARMHPAGRFLGVKLSRFGFSPP